MVKKILLTLVLIILVMRGFSQLPTDGDYRTITSGNWSDISVWQVRTAGNWALASVVPSATNNVYLQTGHNIVIDQANVYCNDLHWGYTGTTYGSVELGPNFLNINGKVRVYSMVGAASVALGTDGSFYSGQTNSQTTAAQQFTNSTTSGAIKFVGNSRTITEADSWKSSGTVCNGVFSLNSGQVGVLKAGMKFRSLIIEGGIMKSDNAILAIGSSTGTGDVTIKNGAKIISSRQSQVITYNSGANCGAVTIEAGGSLELTDPNPEINCVTFNNNGTVIYSGAAENLVISNISGAASLLNYKNLSVTVDNSLKLPSAKTVTINGALNMQSGFLEIPSTSKLSFTNANAAITGGSNISFIKTLANGADIGKVELTALNSSLLLPIGSATNYLPVTLSPAFSSNFSLSVFSNVTQNGMPNGASVDASQKADMVNAVYDVNRQNGTGTCDISFGWDTGSEGANFNSFSDSQISVARYDGASFTSITGSCDNANNTASITTSAFGSFVVGKIGVLPVKIEYFKGEALNQTAILEWKSTSEINLSHYILQRSDGNDFHDIKKIVANNNAGAFNYKVVDDNPSFGTNYYRLIAQDIDGQTTVSSPIVLQIGSAIWFGIYPNPAKDIVNVSNLNKGDVVSLTDLTGRVLKSVTTYEANMVLTVTDFKTGIYFVNVKNSDGQLSATYRLLKN